MGQRSWVRLGAKTLHDVASIGFGGALAACLLINLTADAGAPVQFLAGRQVFAAIAKYILVPAVGIVVVSGLLALAATRGYMDAGWAWMKALLGLAVLEATLVVVGSSSREAEIAQALAATDRAALAAVLRAERLTLWLLIVLATVNVVLAVWRPKFSRRRNGAT